ncbi:MAG: hypothetical protein Q7J29_07660 [Stagnimonas sp.]|nr:hypothetical protein [Stagnimonas sp.]
MLRPPEADADHTETVLDWLADYTIDGEDDALTEACAMAANQPVKIDVLMAGLEALASQRADASRLRQARVALRAALQLPLMPGPVCRAE